MLKPRCVLHFIAGRYQSAEFPLVDSPTRIGNATDLGLQMVLHDDDAVSREHARIDFDRDAIWLEDLGSANGTFVNGARIGKVELRMGDRVIIGGHVIDVIPHSRRL